MNMIDYNDDYDLHDYIQGISNILTIGLDLLLLPGSINLVTIHLMRQVYAEKKQRKKRR